MHFPSEPGLVEILDSLDIIFVFSLAGPISRAINWRRAGHGIWGSVGIMVGQVAPEKVSLVWMHETRGSKYLK